MVVVLALLSTKYFDAATVYLFAACSTITDEHFYPPWCRIAYWEMKNRIGPIFDAHLPCINIFEYLPQGHGLCLSLLRQGENERTFSSSKILDSFGYGFQLTKEEDNVWLYNRSELVLFVGSPAFSLKGIDSGSPVVRRVMPGCSVLVYNSLYPSRGYDTELPDQASLETHASTDTKSCTYKLQQPYCIRVSFGKGWGVNYTRLSITQCPCWVEIYLSL